MDVVQPGQLVGVEEEGGGVEDQLGGGPGQLLHLPVGEVEGVRVASPCHWALQALLLRHLSHLEKYCEEKSGLIVFQTLLDFYISCERKGKRGEIDVD